MYMNTMYFTKRKQKIFRRSCSAIVFLFVCGFLFSRSWALKYGCRRWQYLQWLLPFCEAPEDHFRLFYHLGGNGPWIARHGENSKTLPVGCTVDQVHMMSRHAERYPTRNAGARHLALLARLNRSDVKLGGSLAFLEDWSYFTELEDPKFEDLTNTGPYSGTLQAYTTGKKLRKRYDHLIPIDQTVNFWTCSSPRDIETARHFGDGFFGEHWDKLQSAKLHIIPETGDRGGDTLTPGDTCLTYLHDKVYGHDYGYSELAKWQAIFTKPIGKRLGDDAGGLEFSPLEIYGMMELCGFEILARGASPWCGIFTHEEWEEFEYGRDLLHFYRAGPGNQYAGAMGFLWLNATAQLMQNSSASGVYFSFVHDGDIVPLLATLGILNEQEDEQNLPSGEIRRHRRWKTSDVVPMGGRLVFEKITCDSARLVDDGPKSYVRLLINDGLFDLETAIGGSDLAFSSSLQDFEKWVRQRGKMFGNFDKICGLAEDSSKHITFLHQ